MICWKGYGGFVSLLEEMESKQPMCTNSGNTRLVQAKELRGQKGSCLPPGWGLGLLNEPDKRFGGEIPYRGLGVLWAQHTDLPRVPCRHEHHNWLGTPG